jgi:lactocepin
MMIKKISGLLLAFLLLFSSVAFGAGTSQQLSTKNIQQVSVQKQPKIDYSQKLKESADPNEKVRIIVELKDAPTINYAKKQGVKYSELKETTKQKLEKDVLAKQGQVKEEIKSKNINIKYFHQFATVFNGFSAEVKYNDISKIEKLSNVKKVHIANKYERPKVKPEMKYSKELVEAQKAWEATGYKGEGMVVGIIDTGIDYNHKDMVLTDTSNEKLTKEKVEEITKANNLPGKFYTDKVPYGYNYMDKNDEIRDLGSGASMHGMHVAGTVGANGDENNGGIQGVAPEAQLLALKVFGNDPEMPFTFGDVYVKAIDDAIKLGADVLNMSLGSTAGFVSADDPEQQAVKRAVDNGVLMSISAGNSAYFGNGYYTSPLVFADNPDYGVSGSPGLSYESIQVASYENSFMDVDALQYDINNGEDTGKAAFLSASQVHPNEYVQKTFEVVAAGLGQPEDFEGKDFKGKYALVQRGAIPFVEKALNAQDAGAEGVIIYNNTDGIVNMATDRAIEIPQLFMMKADGEKLRAALDSGKTVKITFTGDKQKIDNPSAGKMSDFTSWGLAPNLDFKPEITAPGGQILSTLNNNQYGIMSGTSMAAPHVSGGAALVLERVDKDFQLKNADRVLMAKNLLMNTAKPVQQNGVFVSPRRQGAGLMQLNAALSTPVIVTEEKTKEAKVALKEITENQVTFKLTAQNFTDQNVTYNVTANVQTDKPADAGGLYVAVPNQLGALDLVQSKLAKVTVNGEPTKEIEVPAHGTATIEVTIDVSEGDADLSQIFKNGYWLEGFVTLTDTEDKNPTLTVPYVGFKGKWDQAPIVDAPAWDENSFYGMTGVASSIGEGFYGFLGYDWATETIDPEKIAFSPNGDGINDDALVVLSFLRNAKEVKFKVLDENKKPIRTLRTEYFVRKNYYDGGEELGYSLVGDRAWDGKINGKAAQEGKYYLQVAAVIDYPDAKWQTFEFPVKLDVTEPTVEANFDKDTQTISINNLSDGEDGSGVAYWDVLVDGQSVLKDAPLLPAQTTYQLKKTLRPDQELVVEVYDYAGNKAVQVLNEGENGNIPDLHVMEPQTTQIVNSNEVTFYGYVEDKSGIQSITVNDEEADMVYSDDGYGYYEFEKTITLDDGVHDIQVTAINNKGAKAEVSRTIMVDTTAPELTVNGVKEYVGEKTETLPVSLNVKDNFDDIRVYVNGEEKLYHAFQEPYEMRPFEQTIEVDLPLEQGENTFELKVVDLAGNETVQEITVHRQKLVGWVKQGDDWYYYNEKEEMQTGWIEVDGKQYYLGEDGVKRTGWIEVDGNQYYLGEDGVMQTGWVEVDGNRYYLGEDGVKRTGWVKDGGKWYYLNDKGVMQTGWVKDGGKWYYLNDKGVMQTGWVKDGGKWYYLNDKGVMQTGWVKDGGKWYYLNANGVMQTGWVKDGGKWYYLNDKGVMQTGWVKDGGKWYYLNDKGVMQTGWVKDGGKWYYLNGSGVMQTGWVKDGGKWYYLNANGVMQTGWVYIGNKQYFFDANGVWVK